MEDLGNTVADSIFLGEPMCYFLRARSILSLVPDCLDKKLPLRTGCHVRVDPAF